MSMAIQTTYNAAPDIGLPGQLDGDDHTIIPMKNAEASVSMPIGTAVCFKTSSPTSDLDAIVVAAGRKVAGIIAKSNAYSRAYTDNNGTQGDLDSTGLRPGVILSVLRRGKILVPCMTGCAPGDYLFICSTAATTYTAVGQLGNADESANTIDSSKQGMWLSTATAGNLAILDVDFTSKV